MLKSYILLFIVKCAFKKKQKLWNKPALAKQDIDSK